MELKLNLTDEEFAKVVELYEKETGTYFLPVPVPEQRYFIRAFELAKENFEKTGKCIT